MKSITFLATIAPIQSAIQAGADGMRLKLEIPENQMAQAINVLLLKDKVLKVTLEVGPERRPKKASEDELEANY